MMRTSSDDTASFGCTHGLCLEVLDFPRSRHNAKRGQPSLWAHDMAIPSALWQLAWNTTWLPGMCYIGIGHAIRFQNTFAPRTTIRAMRVLCLLCFFAIGGKPQEQSRTTPGPLWQTTPPTTPRLLPDGSQTMSPAGTQVPPPQILPQNTPRANQLASSTGSCQSAQHCSRGSGASRVRIQSRK